MSRRRLSESEWQDLIVWIHDRWPTSRIWSRAEALYPDFAHLPEHAIRAAAVRWYESGRERAPSPSQLLEDARTFARIPDGADPETYCPHTTYAVTDLGNGYREAMCANPDCRHIWQASSEKLLTDGEARQMRGHRS